MDYNFSEIEKKWKAIWAQKNIYVIKEDSTKPKFYVLDMFPYPSGSGLHVGHPLGYIASDIIARFKTIKGFNVLHPMGFDSFGLPAEQYAIKTGQHPAITTESNINNFKKQLDNIGFSFDWSREIRTSNPKYYKWTQWIFIQLFHHWFDRNTQKARKITELIQNFSLEGSHSFGWMLEEEQQFTSFEWKNFSEKKKEEILMRYRLAYLDFTYVNWCLKLGTVLANDEVVNGRSERGGYLVERKKMKQWFLRITEYSERLLEGLEKIEFSDAMKEMQKNWIGKSIGAEINFQIENQSNKYLKVFTTRPETLFGADFMVIAPEHPLVDEITTLGQKNQIEEYLNATKNKSELERISEVKQVSGVFTGSYCIRPFDNKKIPIWVSEYVLIHYGTGAIMAVPCGDERDLNFATFFNIPITNIWGKMFNGEKAYLGKEEALTNSDFISGKKYSEALECILVEIEKKGIGKRKVNFKMRDSNFGRQRYWGEPIPIIYEEDRISTLEENELPLQLPESEDFAPVGDGTGPLGKIQDWVDLPKGKKRETDTMPGYAGSSWYFLRYMDSKNENEFCSKSKSDYWGQVDLYVGGTEHAVGHLLYSRMWTNFLYDIGKISFNEPFKKLINQGMITGISRIAYLVLGEKKFISLGLKEQYEELIPVHIDINYCKENQLLVDEFKKK